MVKILIADDSRLTREVVKDLLARDREISVVGEVSDGAQAVKETCRLRPDLIIMDVMMPVMDGLSAITEIMACCPTPILVLSANVDPQDSRSAFNAIKHGALDVMEKPQGLVTEAFGEIAEQLTKKVKFLARVRVMHHFRRPRKVLPAAPPPVTERDILAIGASTGGPKAVMRLMRALSPECGARILIVQHIAKGFAAGFAEWLNRESAYDVRLARPGDRLVAGQALVAPNNVHMEIRNSRVALVDGPPINSCRPAVDALFNSLAGDGLAPKVVAALLTGMGRDGAEGMVALRRGGSFNIAQDETSSAVFGMPRAAIDLGGVHEVLSLNAFPDAIHKLLRYKAV